MTCMACNGDYPYYVYSADLLTSITTHMRIFMIIIASIFMVVVVCNLITHLLHPDSHKQAVSMCCIEHANCCTIVLGFP